MTQAIQLDKVSKRFLYRPEQPRTLQESFVNLFGLRNRAPAEELWALRDISFAVEKGDTVGLIGANGAGKSTLLRLIARILEPTSGRITVKGRVSTLLELGAGFHPELTGRENVYLNGSILGLTRKQIAEKFDELVAFAELERFIDVPVKHYSSGMYIRLGFAVAIHVDPEILLIDEVLAVGDESFQGKCLVRISELQAEGVTILYVSHNLHSVRKVCSRALWLDEGVIRAEGKPETVVERYLDSVRAEEGVEPWSAVSQERKRWGSGEAEIVKVKFLDAQGKECDLFTTGQMMRVKIGYRAHKTIRKPVFGVAIYTSDGIHINGPNTRTSGYDIDHIEGEGEVEFVIDYLPLLRGEYDFTAAIYDHNSVHPFDHHHRMYSFKVEGGPIKDSEGTLYIPCRWRHTSNISRSREL